MYVSVYYPFEKFTASSASSKNKVKVSGNLSKVTDKSARSLGRDILPLVSNVDLEDIQSSIHDNPTRITPRAIANEYTEETPQAKEECTVRVVYCPHDYISSDER